MQLRALSNASTRLAGAALILVAGLARDLVVLDPRGVVDEDATAALRAQAPDTSADPIVDPGTWEYGDIHQP